MVLPKRWKREAAWDRVIYSHAASLLQVERYTSSGSACTEVRMGARLPVHKISEEKSKECYAHVLWYSSIDILVELGTGKMSNGSPLLV